MEFETMGKTKLVDKSIRPMSTVQTLTPSNFIVSARTPAYGAVVIGDYKGAARFLDLDKLVNQPLCWAEQQHIEGILDGREEDYDLQTITPAIGAVVGTTYTGSLTVPSGQVWYINAIVVTLNATGTNNGLAGNWHCSLWTDRSSTPSTHGQPFYANNLTRAAGGSSTWYAEFGPYATAWELTNKSTLLRLPAGAVITLVVTTTTAPVSAAVGSSIALYGFVAPALVS